MLRIRPVTITKLIIAMAVLASLRSRTKTWFHFLNRNSPPSLNQPVMDFFHTALDFILAKTFEITITILCTALFGFTYVRRSQGREELLLLTRTRSTFPYG